MKLGKQKNERERERERENTDNKCEMEKMRMKSIREIRMRRCLGGGGRVEGGVGLSIFDGRESKR